MIKLSIYIFFIFSFRTIQSQTHNIEDCSSWQIENSFSLDTILNNSKSWIKKNPIIKQGMTDIKQKSNEFDIVFCLVAPGGYHEKTKLYRITIQNDSILLLTYSSAGCIKKHVNIEQRVVQELLSKCENGMYNYFCSSGKYGQLLYIIRYNDTLFILDGYGNTFGSINKQDIKVIENSIKVLEWAKNIIYNSR